MTRVLKLKEVVNFINSLPDYEAAVCDRYITLLQEHGWKLRPPYTEHTEGIYILRPSGKGGEYRLFYGFFKDVAFVVYAIHKKTKKLKRKDLKIAKSRLKEVLKGKFLSC